MKCEVWKYMFLAFVFCSSSAFAQRADQFDAPLVGGERSIKFQIDTENFRADLLSVTVFYSNQRSSLNDLSDASLPRGRPVLELDPRFSNRLSAIFVLPHADFAVDPNRSLYIRHKSLNRDVVRYADVEAQLASTSIIGGLGEFLSPASGLPDSPIDINPEVFGRDECVYYRVRITRGGTTTFTSEIQSFRMPDTYNIAIAGDSYGAGEGAPQDTFELVGDNEDMWSHNDCHRSRKSGLVRGVKRFIQHNPDTAIDYIHTACTGARVRNLFDDEQTAAVLDFSEPHPVQFEIIRDDFLEAGDHPELNMLLVSIGGNNAGFGSYVVDFVIAPFNSADDEDLPDEIEENLDRLANRYEELDEAVNEEFPNAKVVISNYPDSTRGPRGRCGRSDNPVDFAAVYSCCLLEVDPITNPVEEYSFTSNEFIEPLNEVIEDAVDDANEPNGPPDWYLVDVEDRMGSHGFCACDDPHINRMGMSIAVQGDIMGIVHPTRLGHKEVYRDPVSSKISEVYKDFVVARKGGILIAILLGIESPRIPASCEPVFIPINRWFRDAVLADTRTALIRKFLKNAKVADAFNKGSLPDLKKTSAYKKFVANRTKAMKVYEDAFAKSMPGSRLTPEVLSTREKKSLATLREYVKSEAYRKLKEEVLKDPSKYLKGSSDDDKLDKFYNRESVKRKTGSKIPAQSAPRPKPF